MKHDENKDEIQDFRLAFFLCSELLEEDEGPALVLGDATFCNCLGLFAVVDCACWDPSLGELNARSCEDGRCLVD